MFCFNSQPLTSRTNERSSSYFKTYILLHQNSPTKILWLAFSPNLLLNNTPVHLAPPFVHTFCCTHTHSRLPVFIYHIFSFPHAQTVIQKYKHALTHFSMHMRTHILLFFYHSCFFDKHTHRQAVTNKPTSAQPLHTLTHTFDTLMHTSFILPSLNLYMQTYTRARA